MWVEGPVWLAQEEESTSRREERLRLPEEHGEGNNEATRVPGRGAGLSPCRTQRALSRPGLEQVCASASVGEAGWTEEEGATPQARDSTGRPGR